VTAIRELEERLEKTIQTLTTRAIQDCNLIVSVGPLAPLTGTQNVAMRVAMANVMRTAIAAGRAHERAIAVLRTHVPSVVVAPDATTYQDPKYDEVTTLPQHRRARGWKAPDLGDE
jgi:hypothetical protein